MTKIAGQTGWQELKEIAPAFSYCLIFASAKHRNQLSDIWHFHLECEKAVQAASEQLLGMIRLQWLADTLEKNQSAAGFTLISRVLNDPLLQDSCLKIVHFWQGQIEMQTGSKSRVLENATAFTCTQMMQVLIDPLSDAQQTLMQSIGREIAQSQNAVPITQAITPSQITTSFGSHAGWVLALHFVSHYAIQANPNTNPLLIFKLFWFVFKHSAFK